MQYGLASLANNTMLKMATTAVVFLVCDQNFAFFTVEVLTRMVLQEWIEYLM
jgi:hypothetical protein